MINNNELPAHRAESEDSTTDAQPVPSPHILDKPGLSGLFGLSRLFG